MFSVDDDDELDEDSLPAFSHPAMAPSPTAPTANKGKGRAASPLLPTSSPIPSSSAPSGVFGNIGSGSQVPKAQRQTVAGVRVESRCASLLRISSYAEVDLASGAQASTRSTSPSPPPSCVCVVLSWHSLIDVRRGATCSPSTRNLSKCCIHCGEARDELCSGLCYSLRLSIYNPVRRDWDLWGPLIFCLMLGVMLSMNVCTPARRSASSFSDTHTGTGQPGLGRLYRRHSYHFRGLRRRHYTGETPRRTSVSQPAPCLCQRIHADVRARSFFQGLCVLGYCIAPLNIAALVSTFVRIVWVRLPVTLAAWAWCVWGACGPALPLCLRND